MMAALSGQIAERCARNFLEGYGLKHLASNFRCRVGELDLVMLHGEVLVFVEVRQRRPSRFANAAQSIDARKQRKLTMTAQLFLQRHPHLRDRPCRFDVIAYDDRPEHGRPPTWLKAAFDVAG